MSLVKVAIGKNSSVAFNVEVIMIDVYFVDHLQTVEGNLEEQALNIIRDTLPVL